MSHIPVLLHEVINLIIKNNIENVIDCTFGAGGHSNGILCKTQVKNISALDVDPSVIKYVLPIKNEYAQRFHFINDKYSNIHKYNIFMEGSKNCFLIDCGLSSMQIDNKDRGFSYLRNSPVNMSMNHNDLRNLERQEFILNQSSCKILSEVIYKFGEEKLFFEIASFIVRNRPIKTTGQIIQCVQDALKTYNRKTSIKTMARVFQALRIYINEEFDELEKLFNYLHGLKEPFMCIFLYFHSLEGKIINEHMSLLKKTKNGKSCFFLPSEKEIIANSRSKSARMIMFNNF